MKQSLTVAVILLCSLLTEQFTVPEQTNAPLPVSNSMRTAIGKWKNTTWVNPWISANKKTESATALNTARIYWSHSCSSTQYVSKFDVTIWGTDYEGCVEPSGQTDQFDIPAGAWVNINIEVHPLYGAFVAYVEDHTAGGTPFYDDIRPYANYGFQVQAGHEYTVWTYTY